MALLIACTLNGKMCVYDVIIKLVRELFNRFSKQSSIFFCLNEDFEMVKYKQYSPDDLEKALTDVRMGMSMRGAAKKHSISYTVINRHKYARITGQPVRMLSSDEEKHLVSYIEYCNERGFPLTRKMVKVIVKEMAVRKDMEISSSGPSNKWYRGFMKRHPNISMRKPQVIDGGRARMSNPTVINQHFSLLKDTIMKHEFHRRPQCIFNMDETGFGQGATLDKVCTINGRGSYTRMAVTNSHSTAAICISADGKVLPTFVIYEKSFPSGAYRDGIPENWLFGVSENGYMDGDLFLKWFKMIFLKYAPSERPLLLTMDNHESHVSLALVEEARANQVELFCLPPHTTHLLQPLDVVMFRPLKKNFSELAMSLGYVNNHLIIGKNRFAQVLRAAVDRTFSPFNIKTSFRKCGIHPVNCEAIDHSKLMPVDKEFMGPGGDNLGLPANTQEVPDPLCHACGQYVRGHPLVNQGIIPAELADIFVPIPGNTCKKNKQTRIISTSTVITGDGIYKQLKEKEEAKETKNKKKPKTTKKKATGTRISVPADTSEEMPTIRPPKRRRKANPTESTESPNATRKWLLADEVYTCGVCEERGWEDDEENNIFWVGCDKTECGRWYHRACVPSDQHALIDLSLLIQSEWYCHLCQTNSEPEPGPSGESNINLSMEATPQEVEQVSPTIPFTNNLICQVCMCEATSVTQNDQILFWTTCSCQKSFHQYCLPKTVLRQYNRLGTSWTCGQC